MRPPPKPPNLPVAPTRLPEAYAGKDPPFVVITVVFIATMFAVIAFTVQTHVDRLMYKGLATHAPVPECGWHATLVCDDVPGVECRWDRRWKCGYGVPWPNVVIRRPMTEEILKERYP